MSIFARSGAKQSGFTLVELSTVIAIVAVLTGSTLVLGSKRIEQQKLEDTKARITLIEKALQNYADVNQMLPCPADPTVNRSVSTFGQGTLSAGSCTGTLISDASNLRGGMVPVLSLGLPPDAAYDGWGRKLMYYVDNRAATVSNFMTLNKASSSCGTISIADESGNSIRSNVLYVVMSFGQDGHGSFTENNVAGVHRLSVGNSITSTAGADVSADGAAASSTAENLGTTNLTGTTADDAIFRSHAITRHATKADLVFDDIVRYKSRRELELGVDKSTRDLTVSNVPVEAGWIYIPDYTLPDGTFVTGFKVMKYEAQTSASMAIQPTGNSAPATAIYTDARIACQAMGTGTTTNLTGKGGLMEYDIMTESQWLSIAHQIAADSRNWSTGCTGNGNMIRGHSDNTPAAAQIAGAANEQTSPGTNDATPYYLTGNSTSSSPEQRRTLLTPSGGLIWDLTGNLAEWVYCDMNYCDANGYADASTFYNGQLTALGTYTFNTNLASNTSTNSVDGETRTNTIVKAQLPPNSWTHSVSAGRPAVASTTANTFSSSTIAVARGGSFSSTTSAGLFSSRIQTASTSSGFRCVQNFRKQPSYDQTLVKKSFDPNSLGGLEIWYDAADIDADGIPEWDSNGNGAIDDTSISISNTVIPNATQTTLGYANANPFPLVDSACGATTTNDGCVRIWMNKTLNTTSLTGVASTTTSTAGNEREPPYRTTAPIGPNWNAVSRRLNGNSYGTADVSPTRIASSSSMNDLPVINFAGDANANADFFDTWWNYTAGSGNLIGSDDGYGYDMSNMSAATIFFVANASEYATLIAAGEESAQQPTLWEAAVWPYYLIFPHNMKLSRASTPGTCMAWGAIGTANNNPINGWHKCGNEDYFFTVGNFTSTTYDPAPTSASTAADTDCWLPPVTAPGYYNNCLGNYMGSDGGGTGVGYRVGACARMGGVTTNTSTGLTKNNTHVATGIFQMDAADGLRAYVDGQSPDVKYSAISLTSAGIPAGLSPYSTLGKSGGYCIRNSPTCGWGDSRDCPNELTRIRLNMILGRSRSSLSGNTLENFKGNVGEIIIYNRVLSAQERMMVERYLADKWGVTYDGPKSIAEELDD